MKPRILKIKGGWWICSLYRGWPSEYTGLGITPESAYADWKYMGLDKKFNFSYLMHRQ